MADDGFLIALGDCNTVGTRETVASAYPLLVARALGVKVVNCGHTMSTVREGWEYARRRLATNTSYLTIQYGLVDSWLTFRGAPYVLYYPDTPARRVLRKLVKKYKKVGRKLGFHRRFGETHYVPPDEYQATIERIIHLARERSPGVKVCLISTAPSSETHRNPGIEQFNRVLQTVAEANRCTFVDAYTPFINQPELLLDHIHLRPEAHVMIARWCVAALRAPAQSFPSGL